MLVKDFDRINRIWVLNAKLKEMDADATTLTLATINLSIIQFIPISLSWHERKSICSMLGRYKSTNPYTNIVGRQERYFSLVVYIFISYYFVRLQESEVATVK